MLTATGLTKRFGGLTAIDNVSFEVRAGEILGLIGPNGAGKTTLFNIVSGYLPPSSGSIEFEKRDVTRVYPASRRCRLGISRTFQNVRPFGNLTVLENVMIGALWRSSGVAEARRAASEIVRFVGLEEKAGMPAKSLTISERKRLELSRALATRPKLLLLDEVLAGLNPTELSRMLPLIREVRDRGVTIMIVEHIMQAIMGLSDRILVIHHGRKIAEGAPKEVSQDEKVIRAYLGEGTDIA